ncbi:two-component sensor histidine kinase [Cellulomonas chitinilytica]|uniref:histidine kinase n=1 Tax=Cellulomonas chitinilytica TaxID=398759 RepID=A0A919NY34_9CELL|nr:two-component sensor histidine kinase [Cellulomonas chitinilytica]
MAARWAVVRRPSVRDAGLGLLLLAGTVAVGGGPATTGGSPETVWPWARWVLAGICAAAVAVRRRLPVPALVAAALATLVPMAVGAGPVPTDLAVPIVLGTIAARRPPRVSLTALGATLAVVAAWSSVVALDGRADGRHFTGPFATGGQVHGQDGAAPGPTAWGGLPVLGLLLVLAWTIGWGVRSRRAYLGEIRARAAHDLEREREQQAALAVAAERARLTREVHDVVAHGLAVIVMQAQGGAAAFARRPADTLAALDTIVATGRGSLADIRHVLSVSGQDDDATAPVPGIAQLPRLAEQVRQAGTPVELQVTGVPRTLPTSIDASSYRIVQEALTNVMKHAGPGAHAEVVVSYEGDGLTIDARDDGAGPAPSDGTGGHGLRGMRERVALLGGELTAGPGPAGGYLVHARLPLDPDGRP